MIPLMSGKLSKIYLYQNIVKNFSSLPEKIENCTAKEIHVNESSKIRK
jgi:hypothetical protein